MTKPAQNHPGGLTNTPQHLVGEETEITEGRPVPGNAHHRQTGTGTAPEARDVADPHPANEEHPYRARHPGGAHPPDETKDYGANPAQHDGSAPARPHNAGSGPQ